MSSLFDLYVYVAYLSNIYVAYFELYVCVAYLSYMYM